MPNNYALAMVAFLHPCKLQVSKNTNMPYDRQLLRKLTSTFVSIVSHLSGETFKNYQALCLRPLLCFCLHWFNIPIAIIFLKNNVHLLINWHYHRNIMIRKQMSPNFCFYSNFRPWYTLIEKNKTIFNCCHVVQFSMVNKPRES